MKISKRSIDSEKRKAQELLGAGRYEQAKLLYAEICKAAKHDAESWSMLGAIEGQLGNMNDAIRCCEKAIKISPNYVDALYNLAQAYLHEKRFTEAVERLRSILAVDSQNPSATQNLAYALRRLGKNEEAVKYYQKSIRLDPGCVAAYNELGLINFESNLYEIAEEYYQKSIQIDPENAETFSRLGNCYRVMGEYEKSGDCFRRTLELDPDNGSAEYYLAAVDSGEIPAYTPPELVQACYDTIAISYDQIHTSDKLSYEVPLLITNRIKELLDNNANLDIVDIGCGTGLCGPYLKDVASSLVGIDLSEGMLEEARKKNIYDELECADFVQYLSMHNHHYDLIISTGVFIHIGDLDPVFQAGYHALRENGLFAFSTLEHVEDGYKLNPTGHYAHSVNYISGVCERAGYSQIYKERVLTYLQNKTTVYGHLHILKKSSVYAGKLK